MDLLAMGTQLLREQLGVNVDAATVQNALTQLLGDGSGDLDVAGLAASMTGKGELGTLLGSWLGDGDNQSLSKDSVRQLFGDEQLGQFASKVGVDTQEAAAGLSEVIPQLLDQASSGGQLLEQFGGADGLLGAAKKFLR